MFHFAGTTSRGAGAIERHCCTDNVHGKPRGMPLVAASSARDEHHAPIKCFCSPGTTTAWPEPHHARCSFDHIPEANILVDNEARDVKSPRRTISRPSSHRTLQSWLWPHLVRLLLGWPPIVL